MTDIRADLDRAFEALPLVAILRGVQPHEVEGIAHAVYNAGFRIIEVPLNSPQALESIRLLSKSLPADAVLGAGTVLSVNAVDEVQAAGGRIIVMPHADVAVIKAAKANGMACVPGVATPTEAFAALHAGADALKLFPAELITPTIMKAMRAVLPAETRLLPVGGVTPDNMGPFRAAGAAGFGLGSALYAPGIDAAEAGKRAQRFVEAWRQ
ncbi:2-dehydro-3-deoxy-6-phosphogalactonate aldolase [Pseudoduganella sp. RAF53_2]|uniref:2-dehydro-3-deoxy-6-phosphogalactonate aldolase n=1 Tax=unclassified Pseudoduganella TaxID=2637179 RepID=UPI003F963F29